MWRKIIWYNWVVIGKMFGLHHLLAPKKDKGELNRTKNYPIAC